MQRPAAPMTPGEARPIAFGQGQELPRPFGKYVLLRRIAAGGMAELFLALQRSVAGFEKLIVIKRILPSMTQDRAFIDMLLSEARIAATLSHPNIVQIFDVGQHEGAFYIAMEHIHGEDIQSVVRAMKGKGLSEFPLEHALSLIIGTCAGLAYAHDRRDLEGAPLHIVHRDISPRNIVVSFTGDVKVVDFGIAKTGLEPGEETRAGQLKGKAPYMSPEQASGKPIDHRSDIFSTGIMLFELTTGRRLFRGASEFDTLKMICDKEYPLPSEVVPDYPPELEMIVMRALSKSPDDRYASARDMQSDLEAFVRRERIAVSQVSLAQWMAFLFAEQLAQQKEALQDVKALADVIAAQHDLGTDTSGSSTGVLAAAGTAQGQGSLAGRRAVWLGTIGAAVFAGAVGTALYARRPDPTPVATADSSATATARPDERARGSLTFTSDPAGCSIWLNGDLRPEETPAKLEHLPLGQELKIRLSKEGFEAFRTVVTLTEAAPASAIDAKLTAGSVSVVLKLEPPATALWVDGKLWKGARDRNDGLSGGEEHKLIASAPGFAPRTWTFTAAQGETKTLAEALLPAGPGTPTTAAVTTAAPTTKTDDKPPPPASGPAKVRVGARGGGYCNVSINGTAYGATPVEATVQSGTVTVTCRPPEGAPLVQSVSVGPGETARVQFKLAP